MGAIVTMSGRQDKSRRLRNFLMTRRCNPTVRRSARGVFAQFVKDLVHLESGQDGLDQDRDLDGAAAAHSCSRNEDFIPEPGLGLVSSLGR